jgi:alpha-tubulin suppressor-like RCC1 family protein
MRRASMLHALVLTLAACSSEVVVLDPYDRMDASEQLDDAALGRDAARDASQLRDGETLPIDDASSAHADGGGHDASRLDAGVGRDGALDADAGSQDGFDADTRGDAQPEPRANFSRIAGFAQTCAVQSGTLYCWGDDSQGQVGVPGAAAHPRPLAIAEGAFVDVCAGEQHGCGLDSAGVVSCWGANTYGELGVGDREPREQPAAVAGPRFASIACGGANTCALTEPGALYCWGDNREGKVQSGAADGLAPTAAATSLRFKQITVGQGHVCALDLDGGLHCWGRNTEGQLGVADPGVVQARSPLAVAEGSKFAQVAAAMRHTCAIDLAGQLLCWGDNQDRLLGRAELAVLRTPGRVGSDADYAEVFTSWFHSCARKRSGALSCWGRNEEGQLGLGDMTPRGAPARVGTELWDRVALGQFHSCGVRDGRLFCWGENGAGQLGLGDVARRYVPIEVAPP